VEGGRLRRIGKTLLREGKNISPVCPRTGKYLGHKTKHRWLIWVFPILGLISLIWFLIRVVPKPSRSTYPCQRVVMPLAGGFIVWTTGLIASTLAYRRARRLVRQSRYVVAGACLVAAVAAVWLAVSVTGGNATKAADPHPANSPVGTAKGLHPGRVVWVHDPEATDWEGPGMGDGHWWQSDHTNQHVLDSMMQQAICGLAGVRDISEAWDLLFRHFNQERGRGDVGYQPGEKITIKVNFVQMIAVGGSTDYDFADRRPDYPICSPQIMYALLDHLVNIVGAAESDITIGDPTCLWCHEFYDMIQPDFPQVRYLDYLGNYSRTRARRSTVPFYWSTPKANGRMQDYVLRSYVDAEYFINLASLKGHYNQAGITLCGKNHYGSLRGPTAGGYYNMHSDSPFSVSQSGRYRNMVDLMGHDQVGGKTFLCLVDGLYAGKHALGYPNNLPRKWQMAPFNNDWPSSLFASQDQVAIDSVGFDFLVAEWPEANGPAHAGADDYLHEAALADNPPSGTFYDPEGDGTRAASLGVHEHWNNTADKRYSRNLGTGGGIELFIPPLTTANGPVENRTAGKKYDYLRHAVSEADAGDEIVVKPGVSEESVGFDGKNVTLRSTDPDDPAVVAATVIRGGSNAVTFSGGEGASCVLAGLTITGGDSGVYCSGASPTISNCSITGNIGAGIELYQGSNPTVTNCLITANGGTGIEMWPQRNGRFTIFNRPTITGCTIAGNLQDGISGGITTITNSIICGNSPPQIAETQGTVSVTFSDVQGGWPGEGNIDADPCFADPDNGDYHLKSQAGRWNPNARTWVRDEVTSPCIDAGDSNSDWTAELWPHGKRINMGVYGGTPQASMSLSTVGNEADRNNDGAVDMNDLLMLTDVWLTEDVLLAEDINCDGAVDFPDFAVLAENWLWHE
jgi:parallel beta-helix repeat protein